MKSMFPGGSFTANKKKIKSPKYFAAVKRNDPSHLLLRHSIHMRIDGFQIKRMKRPLRHLQEYFSNCFLKLWFSVFLPNRFGIRRMRLNALLVHSELYPTSSAVSVCRFRKSTCVPIPDGPLGPCPFLPWESPSPSRYECFII